jgi:hypothetical protein
MANLASFRISQAANPVPVGTYGVARRDILPYTAGGDITLEAENSGQVYRWELIQPPGATGVISGITSQTATLTAEQDGGYIAKLTVNPGSPNEDIDLLYFGIPTVIDDTELCLPALNETTHDNSISHPEYGWWEKMYTFLRILAAKAGTGGGTGDTFFEAGSGTDSLQRIDFGDAQGDYSWSLGVSSEAVGANSWALGANSVSTGISSIAFGSASDAYGDYSFCFGVSVRSLDGSTCFGYGYQNAFPMSLSVGYDNSSAGQITNPQTVRIPVNGITTSAGAVSKLYVDPSELFAIGPVPAYSFMNIQVHVVAKSDMPDGTAPALVTFDGEIQAIATAAGITYQDWTIEKNVLSGTPVYAEGSWDLSVPASSANLTSLDLNIVQDSTGSNPYVIWSGYVDIAIVSTTGGAPS